MNRKARRKAQAKARSQLEPAAIKPTDHAIVRYIERVMGVDMEKVRRLIVTDHVIRFADCFGDGSYRSDPRPEQGFTVVVRDGFVITVMTEGNQIK